jgi:hypothetical protein
MVELRIIQVSFSNGHHGLMYLTPARLSRELNI